MSFSETPGFEIFKYDLWPAFVTQIVLNESSADHEGHRKGHIKLCFHAHIYRIPYTGNEDLVCKQDLFPEGKDWTWRANDGYFLHQMEHVFMEEGPEIKANITSCKSNWKNN